MNRGDRRTARLIVGRAIPLPADTVFPALVGLPAQSRWILATRVSALPSDTPGAPARRDQHAGPGEPPGPGKPARPDEPAGQGEPAGPGDAPVEDPLAVGSRLIARTGVGRLAVVDVMQVTAHQPPRRLTVRHTGRLVRGWGEFGVLPAGSGCRAYWAEEFELPWGTIGRVGWALFGWTVRAGIAASLARLARGLADGSLVPVDPGRPAASPGRRGSRLRRMEG
ncbi:MAG TPA: hypothetical protein VFM01_06830 [Nakamurella sp.]|nr:hypothetical protein [Nakamurella sp.]